MATIWFKGDELTVTSKPFMLHGGEFVTAVDANGKEYTVATAKQQEANADAAKKAWLAQQAQFRKLG